MKLINTLLLFLFFCSALFAQKIEIKPYLQDATPSSIKIMWQTDFGEESIVKWGTTPKLGKKTKGTAFDINFTEKRVHEVQITGLKRFTKYYYQVQTGKAVSEIYEFKTPPFERGDKEFNLVAMSDMQKDWNHPEKFKEVVEEGIITHFKNNYEGSIAENLAFVMIPGDLVQSGVVFSQWQDFFFKQSEKLFGNVPVYPVPGNHEQNSDFYFNYFSLPKNGSPQYAEHWWYKDYSNVRIIGLDSNSGYDSKGEQISWLKSILEKTKNDDTIDFVFAQLHHPHKSELWIPGESKFTGKVVKLLEEFTDVSKKPSIHFFGHTHGYSRGQSKEHKHLWVNVASAGGALDNWGEFEGRDYKEFTVTQDEYGFVVLTVDPSKENPKFTLKRVSRGNNEKARNNEVRDVITVYKNTTKPQTPKIISPKNNSEVAIIGVVVKANNFISDLQKAFHAASNWQVSKSKDFKNISFDSWKQHENWYYKENRQKDDDLSDEELRRLEPNTTYYVRVRYRDQYLNWSDWSEAVMFTTK